MKSLVQYSRPCIYAKNGTIAFVGDSIRLGRSIMTLEIVAIDEHNVIFKDGSKSPLRLIESVDVHIVSKDAEDDIEAILNEIIADNELFDSLL